MNNKSNCLNTKQKYMNTSKTRNKNNLHKKYTI